MPAIAFTAPILASKGAMFRAFGAAMTGSRRLEYEESRRRLGISAERAWLQHTPEGDVSIIYFEAENPASAFHGLATSPEPFDVWFRAQVLAIHGLDLTQPGPPPSEQTIEWTR